MFSISRFTAMQVISTERLQALPVAPAVTVDMEESQLSLSVFISVGSVRLINLWENTHLDSMHMVTSFERNGYCILRRINIRHFTQSKKNIIHA